MVTTVGTANVKNAPLSKVFPIVAKTFPVALAALAAASDVITSLVALPTVANVRPIAFPVAINASPVLEIKLPVLTCANSKLCSLTWATFSRRGIFITICPSTSPSQIKPCES